MKPINEVRTIARSADDVYAYVADMDNFNSWVPGISGFAPPGRPTKVGDTFRFRINGLPMTSTIVTLEPGQRVAYDLATPMGASRVTIEFEEQEPGVTRLTKTQSGDYNWPGRLLGPIVDRLTANAVRAEADMIKQNLER